MRYAFCVLGWYFYKEFLDALYTIDCDKYIVSHRDREFVEALPHYEMIKDDVMYGPNKGVSWGGYYQWHATHKHRDYDFVIYTHDDMTIKDPGLGEAIAAKFEDPEVMVVGNGNNGSDTEFLFGKYRDRMYLDDDDDFVVRTVRGSFFAARTSLFDTIGSFPVYWKTTDLKKGNISSRNFAYLVTKNFGREAITYLEPESHLETKYLVEFLRGEQPDPAKLSDKNKKDDAA